MVKFFSNVQFEEKFVFSETNLSLNGAEAYTEDYFRKKTAFIIKENKDATKN